MNKINKGILRDDTLSNHIKEYFASLTDDEKRKLSEQEQEVIGWIKENFVKKDDNGKRRNDNKESDMDG